MRTSGAISDHLGLRVCAGRLRRRTTNAAPIPGLSDRGADRAAVEAEAGGVDERVVQDDVRDVADRQHDQRCAQVGDPSEEPLAGEDQHEHRDAGRSDAQVARGEGRGAVLAAEQGDELRRERGDRRPEHHADREAEPQRLGRERARALLLPGAVQPRDLRGRPVGEEDAEAEDRREQRRGERQRRQLRRAEVPDDRGVRQRWQRLGRERAESGDREAQDLAVELRAQHRADSTIPACPVPPPPPPRSGRGGAAASPPFSRRLSSRAAPATTGRRCRSSASRAPAT
jgi:hypothetical protein